MKDILYIIEWKTYVDPSLMRLIYINNIADCKNEFVYLQFIFSRREKRNVHAHKDSKTNYNNIEKALKTGSFKFRIGIKKSDKRYYIKYKKICSDCCGSTNGVYYLNAFELCDLNTIRGYFYIFTFAHVDVK